MLSSCPLPQYEGKPAIYRQLLASSSLLATHRTLEIPCRYVFCNPENSFGEKLLYFDRFHLLDDELREIIFSTFRKDGIDGKLLYDTSRKRLAPNILVVPEKIWTFRPWSRGARVWKWRDWWVISSQDLDPALAADWRNMQPGLW